MNTNSKKCINQFEMSKSEHELRMLELEKGWLGRFFEKK